MKVRPLMAALALFCCQPIALAGDWWMTNVLIFDGSGAAPFSGALHVQDGRIAGLEREPPADAEQVLDGGGLALAPGFIDTHSHADDELGERPDALAAVSQGITTAVVGMDGFSPHPLDTFFEGLRARPAAINIAAYAGHNSLRERVLGNDPNRAATAGERERMATLLREDLAAGALGLSSGLEYEPGIHSDTAEVLELAQITAVAGGRYISHLRSEDRWFYEAVDEIIEIGRATGMPVQISHLKLAMKSLWGDARKLIGILDDARHSGVDISADLYPYTYWQTNMMVLIPSRDLTNRAEFAFALEHLAPPDGFWLTRYDPDPSLVGRTLADLAKGRSEDPVDTFMQLAAASVAWETETGEGADSMIGTSMTEEDIEALMAWPHTNFCSDGSLADGHPRGAGSFTRILARYVREQGVLELEEAIHRMTGLAADHLGLADRGRLQPGLAADLVLFDPATVQDHATPSDPSALSSGIAGVWVNGQQVYREGRSTGLRSGIILRRSP